ncbi:hypothetical protein GCM10023205_63980 [Yinghuangia aomiensis]|uniref:Acetyltransferase n=1 Tax=Yinghuangia aomiensis TaxID=676205 RepID=A0ABP9I2H1_9ACTN
MHDTDPAPGRTARTTTGRVLLTVTGLTTMCGAYIADWNDTHVFNPDWPPHAKFHNGQTMSTGLALGAATLYFVWGRRPWTYGTLQLATACASAYWITQMSSILYPGTAFTDPGCSRKAGQPVMAGVTLALNAAAFVAEKRRLRGARTGA